MAERKDRDVSLGDQNTFHGQVKPQPDNLDTHSLGGQVTFGGGADQGDFEDDGMEIVDLAARYKIERVLGKGGMGEVLLASDTRLNRKVAIKRILGEAARSRTAVSRFLTEAQSIAALNHPNIVQIYDYGRAQDGPFLIMEFVEGNSLLDRCREGAMPLEEAVELICQLCDGLGKAHDAGIIHRDIKPANVLMTQDGTPKLTDFGLAKAESADTGMTMAGAVLGTLDFMPPEQRRDAALTDARSDLWSLAATLYQMVTGESPKVIRIKKVPSQLQDVLDKALEDTKEARYQTAKELRAALRDCLKLPQQEAFKVAADLGTGECPSCHSVNESHRKFCRECGDPLRCKCLKCQHEIPVWDKVCPECGGRQAELIATQLQEIQAQRLSAERRKEEHQYQEAIDIAQSIAEIDDRRLNQQQLWAIDFLESTKTEWERQKKLASQRFAEAKKHREAFDYDALFNAIESIPVRLRTREVTDYLRLSKAELAESNELFRTIATKIEQGKTADLQPMVDRFRQLRGNSKELQRLLNSLQCPACNAVSTPGQDKCIQCGFLLSIPCLGCGKSIRVWDRACFHCGGNQAELTGVRLRKIDGQRKQAELFAEKHKYQEALDIAQGIAAIEHRRLTREKAWVEHHAWAIEFLESTKLEWERRKKLAILLGQVLSRQKELVKSQFNEAKKYEEAFDYKAAIQAVESIPEPLRSFEIKEFLRKLTAEHRKEESEQEFSKLLVQADEKRESKDFAAAITCFREALRIYPNNVQAMFAMAYCQRRCMLTDEAIVTLERAKSIEPENATVCYNLACYYWTKKKSNKVIENLMVAIVEDAGLAIRALKDPDLSGFDFKSFGNSLWEQAQSHIKEEDWHAAARKLQILHRFSPTHANTAIMLASSLSRLGEIASAISILLDILKKYPELAIAHYNLACYQNLQGKRSNALISLRRAVEFDKKYAQLAMDDKDFESIKDDEEFLKIIKKSKRGWFGL